VSTGITQNSRDEGPTPSLRKDIAGGQDAEDANTEAKGATAPKKVDRRVVAVAGVLLLACGGLVAYGVLNTEDKPKPRAVPTAEVTYEVLGDGKADISYLAHSEAGNATVSKDVQLPWKKTVRVPLDKDPIVSITLGEKDGRAACTLAIRGKHVQRATAFGSFGRATCTAAIPADRKQ
jgi:hypothetical protein